MGRGAPFVRWRGGGPVARCRVLRDRDAARGLRLGLGVMLAEGGCAAAARGANPPHKRIAGADAGSGRLGCRVPGAVAGPGALVFVCSAEPPVLGSGPGGVVPRGEGRGSPSPHTRIVPVAFACGDGAAPRTRGEALDRNNAGLGGAGGGSPCARSAGAGGLPAPAPTTLPRLPVRGGTCAAAAAAPPPPDYTGAARAAGAEPGRAAIA